MAGRPGRRRSGAAPASTEPGVVVSVAAHHALVRIGESERRCVLRKVLFRDLGPFTRPVAVGDRVAVTVPPVGAPVIESVEPRRRYLSRRQLETGREQIIVANVDQVVILAAAAEPELNLRLVDRLLVAAERGGFQVAIVVNKIDLVADRDPLEERAALYRRLGYETIFASAVTGEGVDSLRARLAGRTSVLAGPSGVGKSTLLNLIEPGLGLRTREISEKWRKGRHTTTAVHLFPLSMGGFVADTPGVRSFGIAGLAPSDIAIFFPDLAPFVDACRFSECTHDHEPGCAVKAAVESGAVDPDRYESYLRIILGMDEEEDERL